MRRSDKRRNDNKGYKALELYKSGLSLAQVANQLGGTRQSIYDLLIRRDGYVPRKKRTEEFQSFNGKKYTKRMNGYFLKTSNPRTLIHRDIWEYFNGKIPDGHDVHHRDHDRSNNAIENLELLTKREHSILHAREQKWHGTA